MWVTIDTCLPVTSTSPSPTAKVGVAAVLARDDLPGHYLGQEADMVREDADLTVDGRQRHHVDVFRVGDCLRRDDFEFQRVHRIKAGL